MGYLHINNLYKAQEILAFKQCYALEKIHGTSAHIAWREGQISFFSGGENYERFVKLFDQEALKAKFLEQFGDKTVVVFGEAYGGKQQGMSPTYGKELKFVAFDVKVEENWLNVQWAHKVVESLGLEFVDYALVSTDLEVLDAERDKPSVQAVRNGITEPKLREGVVLRPPIEVRLNNGDRIIAKHKRAEFAERGTPNVELDPNKRQILEGAEAIAQEWVTPMRLEHVINAIRASRGGDRLDMKDTPLVIKAMQEDVAREAAGEFVDSKAAQKAIGTRTVQLFKERVQKIGVSDE